MGQKTNPIGLRLGISKTWSSNWYPEKNYAENLKQDTDIRSYLNKTYRHIGISKIEINRAGKDLRISILATRPGIIIGRKGEEAEKVKKELERIAGQSVVLNVKEIKKPEIDAQVVAHSIALQIERRVAFRRVIKRAMQSAMRFNINGCKIMIGGRLNGAEIARSEWIREGRIPLHTLKYDIDYATFEAHTTYGVIGIKVWIFRGETRKRDRRG